MRAISPTVPSTLRLMARRRPGWTWVGAPEWRRCGIIEFITIWVILCLSRKEAQLMLRYHDLPAHSSEVLDLTSLTVDEFTVLVPPFEAAFWGYMAE